MALGFLSVVILWDSHTRGEEVLQQTVTSMDNVAESRRRLLNAYLIHQSALEADATFSSSSAQAELRAAEYALTNWFRGRSGIIDYRAAIPVDSVLIPLGLRYRTALAHVREVLAETPGDAVEVRRSFSGAEGAATALQTAILAQVRSSDRSEEQGFRIRLAAWAFLLLVSGLGVRYARRALQRAEARETRTQARLARLREAAPVGIVECGPDGRVLAANHMWCRLTGRKEGEWVGRPWWDALAPEDRDRARSLGEDRDNGEELTAEVRLTPRDPGTDPVWLLVRTASEVDAPDRGRHVVTFTDISKRRQVEAQLHHAQKLEAVGRLAGGVAHDFNNILTSISGFASLARGRGVSPDLDADLEEVERAADRGRTLTRQLLTFSRRERIEPVVVDMRDIVRDLHPMLDRLVPGNIDMDVVLQDETTTVLADRGQLEQVLTNLVVNASDAIDGKGRIRIAVERVHVEETFRGEKTDIEPGSYVLLLVSDDGPGIPPAVRARMFEPFYTTKERGKGTGLGLSTVWGIVRQCGGHIHVYSDPEQGTVFKLFLPAAQALAAEAAGHRNASVQAPSPPPGTVLVVEDEDAVRRLAARVLKLQGWTVLEAADGEEAVAIANNRAEPIDVLVTDLMMHGMGGVELSQTLRERSIEIPTLFVSGYADSGSGLEGAHFLEKPYTPAALVRSVNDVYREARERLAE